MVTSKQTLDLVDSAFWKLNCELLPVSVFDLKETSQVIGLEQHKSDEASIELLVSFDFILELATLMPVELFFVHRQG